MLLHGYCMMILQMQFSAKALLTALSQFKIVPVCIKLSDNTANVLMVSRLTYFFISLSGFTAYVR